MMCQSFGSMFAGDGKSNLRLRRIQSSPMTLRLYAPQTFNNLATEDSTLAASHEFAMS